jgi:hypothetical protein
MTLETPAREYILPTLPPTEAIGLILRQPAQFEEIEKLHPGGPKTKQWHVTTEGILQAAFGKPKASSGRTWFLLASAQNRRSSFLSLSGTSRRRYRTTSNLW